MSKKLCKKDIELKKKAMKKAPQYRCKKCELYSPKEKWICKPETL